MFPQHDQWNTIDISILFLRFFLRGGGGAQYLTLPPGASYPRYATELLYSSIAYLNTLPQLCSGKFSLVGTLAWHYGHISYRYRGGGGA